jgi:hypothetical protein
VATAGSYANGGRCLAAGAGVCTVSARYLGEAAPLGLWSDPADVTVTVAPAYEAPEGRFLVAFDSATLDPYPVWTALDQDYPNLVTSYSIDRGRVYELDRTDAGRATVQITDPDGILSPLNPGSPFWDSGAATTKIRPLLQAAIGRYDPVAGEWSTRFRGFVVDYGYEFDPSQVVNRLTVELADLFDILARVELQPGQFGDIPTDPDQQGQIVYPAGDTVEGRIGRILDEVGLPARFRALLPGAVLLHQAVYSAGESPITAIQEAADADFPQVSNVFCDRRGRLCFHGRLAKFDPAGTAAGVGSDTWDYHEWSAGDGAAIDATPDTIQLRQFGFERGSSQFVNAATATPVDIADADVPGQLVVDGWSISLYGINSWSASSLLTKQSLVDGADDLEECRRFGQYMAANYKWPHDRLTALGFRSLDPSDPRAPALWEFLNAVDVGDRVAVTIQSPGGGGYTGSLAKWFVEGVHEQVRPLQPGYDDVTLTLDLSPAALFEENPWPDA